jgi:hypothetical protein
MDSVANWPRDSIGMTSYMVHAHFRPFLRYAFETSPGEYHKEFSSDRLYTNESVAPIPNNLLTDFGGRCCETRDFLSSILGGLVKEGSNRIISESVRNESRNIV